MSFVKKVFKKKFKIFKKIVKSKWFKYIVIAAAIVFTAGIAAGGFAAFAGVNSIGGFFVAAGQTMATGAAAITGALGFSGTSAALAAHGGAAATAAGLAGAPVAAGAAGAVTAGAAGSAAGGTLGAAGTTSVAGTTNVIGGGVIGAGEISAAGVAGGAAMPGSAAAASALPGMGAAAGGATAAGATAVGGGGGGMMPGATTQVAGGGGAQAGTGVYSAIQNTLAKPVLGNLTGGQMLMSGVTTALTASLNAKKGKTKEPNGFVAGDVARGGRAEAPPAHTYVRGSESSDVGQSLAGAEGDATVTAGQAAAQPTLAGEMSQAPAAPVESVQTTTPSNIRSLVAERGPVGQEQQIAQEQQAQPVQQQPVQQQGDGTQQEQQGLYAGTQGIPSLRNKRTFVSTPTNIARGLI